MNPECANGSAQLVASGVSKSFFRKGRQSAGEFLAVEPIDLTLKPGEFVALMGRSGSGKTTLLNMLCGLLKPSSGEVLFGGKSLYTLDDDALSRLRNESFGIIGQGQTVLHSLTVIENVKLPTGLFGGQVPDDESVFPLLDELGISGLADSYPKELSGGELRRVAIARALVGHPSVVFADEPTGDLDDENTQVVLELLRKTTSAGASVFVVTHESAVGEYADAVYRMNAGRIQEGRATMSR